MDTARGEEWGREELAWEPLPENVDGLVGQSDSVVGEGEGRRLERGGGGGVHRGRDTRKHVYHICRCLTSFHLLP